MLAKVNSASIHGLDGELVTVEVDISRGLPNIFIVGLPDAAVSEAKERVRSAIRNSALSFPPNSKVVVNLSPADTRKEGPGYDLPIALGVIMATGQVVADIEDAIVIGELALDGAVRPVRGVLPMVAVARARGVTRAFVPAANAAEAALVSGVTVYAIDSISTLAAFLLGAPGLEPFVPDPTAETFTETYTGTDFADVVGQEHAKRALEIAAAGGHNAIMRGPPGSGKTLLARAMPSILPPMTDEESMEVTRIYSVAGLLPTGASLIRTRPFRSPHHTVSNAGLVGGGSIPRPGEVTLAHRGILFLDELPEFDPRILEVLRQPLEDRQVSISRAKQNVTFPANFSLIGSMNPCSCGWYGDPERECTCPPQLVSRYQRRISGPLLDRVDVFIDVPRVPYEKLANATRGEPSAAVVARVTEARRVQHRRFLVAEGAAPRQNCDMTPPEVRDFCQALLAPGAADILNQAARRLVLSARSFHRVLKLSRTIADLSESETIAAAHIAEALQYRERES